MAARAERLGNYCVFKWRRSAADAAERANDPAEGLALAGSEPVYLNADCGAADAIHIGFHAGLADGVTGRACDGRFGDLLKADDTGHGKRGRFERS